MASDFAAPGGATASPSPVRKLSPWERRRATRIPGAAQECSACAGHGPDLDPHCPDKCPAPWSS